MNENEAKRTDTPRTDELIQSQWGCSHPKCLGEMTELARELEAEVSALKRAVRKATGIVRDLYQWELIEAHHTEDQDLRWEGRRRDMPEEYIEISNLAGIAPDEMAMKLEEIESALNCDLNNSEEGGEE